MKRDQKSDFSQSLLLSPTDLRRLCPLIPFADLKAGDVILTSSEQLPSKVIANVTGGEYSHAAIWLPIRLYYPANIWGLPPWRELHLSESDRFGVGETPTRLLAVNLNGGRTDYYISLGNGIKKAIFIRHPRVGIIDADLLDEGADQIRFEEFYKAYSKLGRLIEATSWPDSVRNIVRSATEFLDSDEGEVRSGVFCSELVARYFEIIGIPLFGGSKPCSRISPNDLLHSDMQSYGSIILSENDIPDSATGMLVTDEEDFANWSRCKSLQERLHGYNDRNRDFPFKSPGELAEFFQNGLVEQAEEIKNGAINRYLLADQQESRARQIGDIRATCRFYNAKMMHLVSRALMDEQDRVPSQDDQSEFIGPFFFEVQRFISSIRDKICRKATRMEILSMAMLNIRQVRASYSAGLCSYSNFLAARKEAILIWLDDNRPDKVLEREIDSVTSKYAYYSCPEALSYAAMAIERAQDRVRRFSESTDCLFSEVGTFIPE